MKNNTKKLMSLILIVSLFCTFLSAAPSYADELQTELSDETQTITKYDIMLDEYFAGRENLYLSSNSDFDPKRWEFIQDWKEMLGGITFRSANIEWTLTEVMSETTSNATLRIYEYISLVYVCNGYDVERNMKFGLDHILRLTKEDGGYQISSDTYIEPTGHKFGSSEDLAVFEAENATLADFSSDTTAE